MIPRIMGNSLPPTHFKPARRHIAIWAGIMLATLALCLYDWNGYQVGTYGDDSVFVTNADSLVKRVPYGMVLKPNENEPTQFPFVFPMLLAPVRAVLPNAPDATRIIPLLMTLLTLSVLFWGWRLIGKGLSYRWGLAMLALTALSPLTILHARTVMSEAPFLTFCVLTIWWLEHAIEKSPRAWGIVLGLCFIGVVYTRTLGWALVPFWLAYLLWQKRRAAFLQLGVTALTMLGVLLLVVSTTTVQVSDLLPQEYVVQWSNFYRLNRAPAPRAAPSAQVPQPPSNAPAPAEQIAGKVRSAFNHLDLATALPQQLERALKEWSVRNNVEFLRFLPGVLVLALFGFGCVDWIRRTGLSAFQLMAPPYLFVLVLWAWVTPRFFYPIQPQVFLASLLGWYAFVNFFAARFGTHAQAARWAARLTLLVLVCTLIVWLPLALRALRLTVAGGDQYARAAILHQYLPPDAIAVDVRADTDSLYTDRRFITLPYRTENTAALIDYFQRQQINHVVMQYGVPTRTEIPRGGLYRFTDAIRPLFDAGVFQEIYADAQNDLAIYRVRADVLNTLE